MSEYVVFTGSTQFRTSVVEKPSQNFKVCSETVRVDHCKWVKYHRGFRSSTAGVPPGDYRLAGDEQSMLWNNFPRQMCMMLFGLETAPRGFVYVPQIIGHCISVDSRRPRWHIVVVYREISNISGGHITCMYVCMTLWNQAYIKYEGTDLEPKQPSSSKLLKGVCDNIGKKYNSNAKEKLRSTEFSLRVLKEVN